MCSVTVFVSLENFSKLYHSIIKLPSLQPILMVTPGRGWHSAVWIQKDSEASHKQEKQEHQQQSNQAEASTLLCANLLRQPQGGHEGHKETLGWQLII